MHNIFIARLEHGLLDTEDLLRSCAQSVSDILQSPKSLDGGDVYHESPELGAPNLHGNVDKVAERVGDE